nr:peptidyl-prolyl cis-trans isomerase [uncultured Bacteroides sp.]
MKIVISLLIFASFFGSCMRKDDHTGKTPLVEVDENFLYKEDLYAAIPPGLSKDDSLLFAKHYIRNWTEDVLLYNKAKSNIPENSEIDKLVENYRKALIMHTYQQELINQKLAEELSEQEIVDYYEKNRNLFILEHPLIKGLFIKLPLTAPQVNRVRKWYKLETSEAIDHLEKYSLQNAVSYEYFYDKWVSLSDLLDRIPLKVLDPENYLRMNRQVELKDTAYYYFLNVSDYRKSGEQKPYELAKFEVKDMLVNKKQLDFMKKVKDDLYQRAMSDKKIINY